MIIKSLKRTKILKILFLKVFYKILNKSKYGFTKNFRITKRLKNKIASK